MKSSLAILGASGHGKVVADSAMASGWERVFFFDDSPNGKHEFWGQPILGDSSVLLESATQFTGVIVAIGSNRARLARVRELMGRGARVVSVAHPSACIGRDVEIGAGTVVFAGSVIQPGSSLGVGVIVNSGATVDHDCVLADGVHVSPGAHLAGSVTLGECAWLGIGCSVRQRIFIGADALVGAGAVVVDDVLMGSTVIGVPARRLNRV